MITSQDILKELESVKAIKDAVDFRYTELKEKRHADIQVIEDKYKKEMEEFNTKIFEYNEKISELEQQARILLVEEEWQEATSRGVINEFYINTMLKKCQLRSGVIIKQKKLLSNGIVVWMIHENDFSEYKLYLAFYEGKLVGTSYRDVARHAGDETHPYSFIGQFDKPLLSKKKYAHSEKEYEVNATFTVWMKELDRLDVEEITLIPMNQNTLDEIRKGVNNYWDYYGWERKEKSKLEQ